MPSIKANLEEMETSVAVQECTHKWSTKKRQMFAKGGEESARMGSRVPRQKKTVGQRSSMIGVFDTSGEARLISPERHKELP